MSETDTLEPKTQAHPVPTFPPIIVNTFQEEYDFLTENLPFDRYKADEHLQQQSVLIDLAGEMLNKASRQFNQIKLLLEIKEAELNSKFRRDAEQSGKKTTEKSLETDVATAPEVVALKQAKMEAEDVKNMWVNRKSTYDSRGRDLHDEVQLIVCGFVAARR